VRFLVRDAVHVSEHNSRDLSPQENDQHHYRDDCQQVRDRRSVPKDEQNYVEIGDLMPGTVYVVQVKSFNEGGESEWSEPSEPTEVPPARPGAPDYLTATKFDGHSLTVDWPMPYDNGRPITHCLLKWRECITVQKRRGSSNHLATARKSVLLQAGDSVQSGASASSSTTMRRLQGEDVGGTDEAEAEAPEEAEFWASSKEAMLRIEQVKVGAHTICRWRVHDLRPGRHHLFRVQCLNLIGSGPWVKSRPLRTRCAPPEPPTVPVGVPFSATLSSVEFCWDEPEECGGEEVIGYEIKWGIHKYKYPTFSKEYVTDIVEETNKVDDDTFYFVAENMGPGDTCVPSIRCWNMIGLSTWCDIPHGKALEALCSLPGEPSVNLEPPVLEEMPSVDRRPYALKARWITPDLNGSQLLYFMLRFDRVDGSGDPVLLRVLQESDPEEWAPKSQLSKSYVHEGLVPGELYTMRVRSSNHIGDAVDWGVASKPIRVPADIPLQPPLISCPWQWPTALEMHWDAPCEQGSALTIYELRYSESPKMIDLVNVDNSRSAEALQSRQVVIEELKHTTAYYFQLRAANAIGWSPWSEISRGFLTKACRPAAPNALEVVELLPETLIVRWKQPSDHGAVIFEYDLVIAEGKTSEELVEMCNKANKSQTEDDRIDSLTPDDPWLILETVQAECGDAPDSISEQGEEGNPPLFEMHTFFNLVGGQTYSAAVRARNNEGTSDWSPVLDGLLSPPTFPQECPSLRLLTPHKSSLHIEYRVPYASGAPITEMSFRWFRLRGPSDVRGTPDYSQVPIELRPHTTIGCFEIPLPSPGPALAKPRGFGGSEEATLPGLEPGAEYDMQVCAKNICGFGEYSEAVRMTCLPDVPDAPRCIKQANPARATRYTGAKVESSVLFEKSPLMPTATSTCVGAKRRAGERPQLSVFRSVSGMMFGSAPSKVSPCPEMSSW